MMNENMPSDEVLAKEMGASLNESKRIPVQAIGKYVYVNSPYNAAMLQEIRRIKGAKWMKEWKVWRYDLHRWEDVRSLYSSYFNGFDVDDTEKVLMHVDMPGYSSLYGSSLVFPDTHTMKVMGRHVAGVLGGKVVLGEGVKVERGRIIVGATSGGIVFEDLPVTISIEGMPFGSVLDHVGRLAARPGMDPANFPIKLYGGENPNMAASGSSVAGDAPPAPSAPAPQPAALNLSPDDTVRKEELDKLLKGFSTRRISSGLPAGVIAKLMAKHGVAFA